MRKSILLCIVFLVAFSGTVFAAKWQNSLKPRGKTVSVNLVQNGKSLYRIVIPKDSDVNETLASKDLAEYLGKIFSADFLITTDSAKISGKYISLGNTKQLKDSKISVPKLNRDGYALIVKDGNIYITGGVRGGSLSGVYALLEEDLGCRWYTNKYDERIPKINSGKLEFVPRSYSPQFLLRYIGYPEFMEKPGYKTYKNKERPFARRNRLNMFEPNGGVHCSLRYVPPAEYFEEHPDWFCMKKGVRTKQQLCYSSEGMYQALLANMRETLKEYDKDTFMVSPEDSISLCECPECKALSDREGTNMAPYLKCMNRIAEELEKDYPNLIIQVLAYLDYVKSPKTILPRKNVEIMVCSDSCDWNYPLCTLRESKKFSAIMDDWTKKGNVITWNYVSNYDHLIMPNPNLTVISKDIKQMKDWGVKGSYLQGIGWENVNLQASGRMKVWVWGKQLWDQSRDTDALLRDFCYGYFGDEIGDLMYEYEKSLVNMYNLAHAMKHDPNEDTDLNIENGLPVFNTPTRENKGVVFDHGIRWTPDVKMYTPSWVDRSMKLMDKALELAKTDEEKEKVRYMRTNILYLYIAQKIGYIRLSGKYIDKPELQGKELEKVRAAYNELNDTLTGYGTYLIAEIADQNHTKEKLMKKWEEILYPNNEK